MKRKIISIVLAAALVLGIGVPMNDAKTATAAKAVKISAKKLTLPIGGKTKLKIKNTKKKVKWSSTKKKVATVSKKGVVKAKKKGSTVIVAKIGKATYKCKVTVKKTSISAKTLTLKAGAKKTLKLKGITKGITWSSNNKKVATVTKKGVVTAVAQGKATITAKLYGKKYKCAVTVQKSANSNQNANNNSNNNAGNGTNDDSNNSNNSGGEGGDDASDTPADPTNGDVLTFSNGSGTYDSAFDLTISSNIGAQIYYTTDGSDPRESESSIAYTDGISIKSRENDANVLSAISPDLFDLMNYKVSGNTFGSYCVAPEDSAVDKCTVVKAATKDAEGKWSAVATNTYFIGKMSNHIDGIATSATAAGNDLAVISITVDKEDLFDHETGIYVKGKKYEESLQALLDAGTNINSISPEGTLDANFLQRGRTWERNAHIDYFESDGTTTEVKLQQDCGIRIQGNYSRHNVQKSFRLYAREDYGAKNFKYEFFGDAVKDADGENLKKFKTLVLRNGGNDAFNYKYKDIFMQSFMSGSNCVTLAGRPCVVYLNGEYWGFYVLQDDVTDNFLEEHLGVDNKKVVGYKASDQKEYADYLYKLEIGDLPEDVTEIDYYLKDTLNYLDKNDFSDSSVYQEFINTYLDESSAVDYFASMIYLNNGWDWPSKNWFIWKTTEKNAENAYSDNKWRFILTDLDLTTVPTWSAGLSDEWQGNNIGNIAVKNSSNVVKKFFGNLMDNATFRTKLAERLQTIGTNEYNADLTAERGAQYKKMYGSLSSQFLARFNSNGELYSIGESNHNANMDFLSKRNSYVSNLINTINSYAPAEKVESEDGVLAWTGTWTRGSGSNVTTSETEGLSTERDDSSYIKLTVEDWSKLTNPVIKITVADGAAEAARCHIWDETQTLMHKYYYENEEAWIEQEISIEALRGTDIYVNANDATITKIEIYSK